MVDMKVKRKGATNKCPILTFSRSSSSGQKRIEKEREKEWEKEWEKGSSIRGTPSVFKRLPLSKSVTPVQPVADALKLVTTPVQPVADALKLVTTPVQPVADALDEDTICRKAGTIVDELTQNRDFKVRESYYLLPFHIPYPSSQCFSLFSFVGSISSVISIVMIYLPFCHVCRKQWSV